MTLRTRNRHVERVARLGGEERGAALVEFALVLPILLVILLGILDFGLYYYNDLQLTHAARDAARYLSVGKVAEANDAIDGASLVSTTITSRAVDAGSTGNEATGSHSLLQLPHTAAEPGTRHRWRISQHRRIGYDAARVGPGGSS